MFVNSAVGILVTIATAVLSASPIIQQISNTTAKNATPEYHSDSVTKKSRTKTSLGAIQQTIAEADSQEEIVIILHENVNTAALQEDNGTAVHQKRGFVATRQDDGDTAIYQSEVTRVGHQNETDTYISQKEGNVGLTTSSDVNVRRLTKPKVVDPKRSLRVPTVADQMIKCFCGIQEVHTADGCKVFPGGTYMHTMVNDSIVVKPLVNVTVAKQDVYCAVEDGHRELNFTRGQFYWRKRGDIVLMEAAGYYQGLRIENYCITHKRDDQGELTWTLKGCVSPPSVPVCCPQGQALQDGVCRSSPTPELLTPDISTDRFRNKKDWPLIRNQYNPINCTDEPLKSIPLSSEVSFLAHLPTGLMHVWKPPGVYHLETTLSKYCVSAEYSQDGSLKYSANMCYSDPKETHSKMCGDNICVRKCCDTGDIFSISNNRCVPYNNATFEPRFSTRPSHYNTVYGYPFCKFKTRIKGIPIIDKGSLIYGGRPFLPSEYCVDQFSNGKGLVEEGALACLSMESTWRKSHSAVFRVCFMISIFFQILTVLCYYMVPTLMQKGGWYNLCHVVSLMVGFLSILIQQTGVLRNTPSCAALGLLTQFAFLAAFFWLHILCFDTWRTIRSLTKFMTPSNKSNWVYPLYAFGGPLVIGTITACMHFFAPNDVAGVIKPLISDSSCWFSGDQQLLVYFYGPVAFLFASNFVLLSNTYWNCRSFQLNSAILRDYRSGDMSDETALNNNHPQQNHISNFKQQFFLLVFMLVCWSCEVLSWKIPHPEIWLFTDVLNSLQGFFIFVIFMANGNKRRQLAEKYPNLFSKVEHIFSLKRVKSCIPYRGNDAGPYHLDVISRLRGNLPSFHATIPTPRAGCSLASDYQSNIIPLSHAHLTLSNRPLCSPGFDDVSSSQLNTTNVDCFPESENVSSTHSGGITSVECSP